MNKQLWKHASKNDSILLIIGNVAFTAMLTVTVSIFLLLHFAYYRIHVPDFVIWKFTVCPRPWNKNQFDLLKWWWFYFRCGISFHLPDRRGRRHSVTGRKQLPFMTSINKDVRLCVGLKSVGQKMKYCVKMMLWVCWHWRKAAASPL